MLHPAQSLSIRGPSPETQPQTINVVLFGETGVGKSSVINLIARKDIAKVSSDVNGCTMQYQYYPISFDNMDFTIYDTIGLEEPQMGVNGYLKAIEKAYELISKLSAAGGIHLLLFCMRGGRITATTQSNYRLFCECLCNTKVPIALVFTGLEREEKMEDWWTRNKTHIEHYGIKSDGHACITAVQDDTGEEHKYEESQETIRKLLKTCAIKGEAFSLESYSWFAGFMRKMKGFVPAKKSPKKKDVLKVLTNRCKLDAETAKRIAEMMDKSDTENKDQPEDGGSGKERATENKAQPAEGGEDRSTENETPQPVEDGNGRSTENKVPRPAEVREDRSEKKVPQTVDGGKDRSRENKVLRPAGVREDHSEKKVPQTVDGGKDRSREHKVLQPAEVREDHSEKKVPQTVDGGKDRSRENKVLRPGEVGEDRPMEKKVPQQADGGKYRSRENKVPQPAEGTKDRSESKVPRPAEVGEDRSREYKVPQLAESTKDRSTENKVPQPAEVRSRRNGVLQPAESAKDYSTENRVSRPAEGGEGRSTEKQVPQPVDGEKDRSRLAGGTKDHSTEKVSQPAEGGKDRATEKKVPQPVEGGGGTDDSTESPTKGDTSRSERDKPKAAPGAVPSGGKDPVKRRGASVPLPNNFKAVPTIGKEGSNAGRSRERVSDGHSWVKLERR